MECGGVLGLVQYLGFIPQYHMVFFPSVSIQSVGVVIIQMGGKNLEGMWGGGGQMILNVTFHGIKVSNDCKYLMTVAACKLPVTTENNSSGNGLR